MKMHWCTAKINLSGQNFTIIVVDPLTPISWPEYQVLSLLHGEENVFDVKACKTTDDSPSDEKRRLLGKYGPVVEKVFPGRVFRMEMLMPGEDGVLPPVHDGEPVSAAKDEEYAEDPIIEPGQTAAVFKPGKHARLPHGHL